MTRALARAAHTVRVRSQDGFGLVELMIALTVLVIGIFATFGMFESSLLHLGRSAEVTTATAVGEQQMENFRALKFDAIGVNSPFPSDALYTGDTACTQIPTSGSSCTTTGSGSGQSVVVSGAVAPEQTSVAGADGRTYRVDTYVRWWPVSSGVSNTRLVKRVTVLVRDTTNTNKVWARVISDFDASTGQ